MSSYWERKAQAYISQGPRKGNCYGKRASSTRTPATPPPPLGPLLKSLRVDDLDDDPDNQHSATIQDCEVVSSYNWLDTNLSQPTILIPGKPPLWSPPPNPPPQLLEDSGVYHRDRNAARYPSHPLEPALITCLRTNLNPSLIPSLDIVACSSTLGNLLRFVRGQDKTFRILVEKVGTTLFFVRRENSPTETIPDVRGYGHAFPEAYTTWERAVKGSSSHQRIITYRFGGLRLLVRFEADGYMEDGEGGLSDASKGGGDEDQDVDGLFSSLKVSSSSDSGSTAISEVNNGKFSSDAPTLTIRESHNTLVPQSQIFDLKTRSIRARGVKDTLSEELPRLWVSQIPRFILAYHTRGLFRKEDMEIKDVRDDVKRWEKEQNEVLGKLVGLLKRIREAVDEIDGNKMEIVHREDAVGVVEIREQGWPDEKLSLDGGKDGNGDKEKKIDKIKGDKVMSDAIRGEWIKVQAGHAEGADEKSDIRKKDEKEKSEEFAVRDERKYVEASDNGDESDGWTDVTKRYMPRREVHEIARYFEYDDDYSPWNSDNEEQDFTACSLEDCGYCGRCPY